MDTNNSISISNSIEYLNYSAACQQFIAGINASDKTKRAYLEELSNGSIMADKIAIKRSKNVNNKH